MFRTALLALFTSAALADTMRANTRAGRTLLSSATVVEPARDLADYNNYNNGQNQNGGDDDGSWIASYYIKYEGCSSTVNYDTEGGGDENPLITANLVKFKLCPDSCSSCSNGGLYVVGMMEFVQAYNEMKMDEQEYKCELQATQCQYNQNCQSDEQYCENLCFTEAGMTECIQYEGQEEFELDQYMECAEADFNNDNNNNNNGNNQYNNNNNGNNQYNNNNNGNNQNYWYTYYMGPYCASDGKSIHLGLFTDDGCVVAAEDTSIYKSRTGVDLPYASQSIIPAGECMSCEDPEQKREYEENQYNGNNNNNNNNGDNNGNNGWYYDAEPSELCQESYERAVKCETNMNLAYPDTTGCTFINNYLGKLESASRSFTTTSGSGSATAAVFAWLFGFTTLMFGAYAYFLYRKIKRGAVSLSGQGGAMA